MPASHCLFPSRGDWLCIWKSFDRRNDLILVGSLDIERLDFIRPVLELGVGGEMKETLQRCALPSFASAAATSPSSFGCKLCANEFIFLKNAVRFLENMSSCNTAATVRLAVHFIYILMI